MSNPKKWIQTYSLNNCMLVRTVILYAVMLTSAVAFHENTFAVFELKEDLQIRMMNLWELFQQLEYVEPHQRAVVYEEIQHIRSEIQRIVDLLLEHDRGQHP
jgi:protein associated with RNAse G/E